MWSASELGLNDVAAVVVAENLYLLVWLDSEHGWPDVLRLAGKLGIVQYERLQRAEKSRFIRERVNEVLGS